MDVLIVGPIDRDGSVFPLDKAQVLAGLAMRGVRNERATVIERGLSGRAHAIGGVADVVEGVRGQVFKGTRVQPDLGGVLVLRCFVGGFGLRLDICSAGFRD